MNGSEEWLNLFPSHSEHRNTLDPTHWKYDNFDYWMSAKYWLAVLCAATDSALVIQISPYLRSGKKVNFSRISFGTKSLVQTQYLCFQVEPIIAWLDWFSGGARFRCSHWSDNLTESEYISELERREIFEPWVSFAESFTKYNSQCCHLWRRIIRCGISFDVQIKREYEIQFLRI